MTDNFLQNKSNFIICSQFSLKENFSNFFCLSGKKENFEKTDYITSMKLGKWELEEETSSNQGKIDRMSRRLRHSSSKCILYISSTWTYHAFISSMSLYWSPCFLNIYCFDFVSFIGTQSVAPCRKKLKIGDINFTTGENDANTCNNGDTVTTPTCNDTSTTTQNYTIATATKYICITTSSTELFCSATLNTTVATNR